MALSTAAAPGRALSWPLAETVDLLAERGYALSALRLARLLGADADDVRAAAADDPRILIADDHVAPLGREDLIAPSIARARAHATASARWRPVALDYARAVARHVPWARVVLLSGSLASGGSEEEDDLDVSLVVEDGAKHLAYAACLLIAARFAWRHRRRAHRADARLPFAPKLVCINVVWTQSEARPFERRDLGMAVEVALSEPVWGAERWRAILVANPSAYPPRAAKDEVDAPPSRLARALRLVPKRPANALCYQLARVAHAWVRWLRRRDPATRARVARLEATKHPYAILDRPPRRRD